MHRRCARALGAIAVVLWILGIEVQPGLHLASHDAAPHTHAADGTPIAIEGGEVAARLPSTRYRNKLELGAPVAPGGHRVAGFGHRATALHQPPPPIVRPLPITRVATWLIEAPIARATAIPARPPTARGPPAA